MRKYLWISIAIIALNACTSNPAEPVKPVDPSKPVEPTETEEQVITVNNDKDELTSQNLHFYKDIDTNGPTRSAYTPNSDEIIGTGDPVIPDDVEDYTSVNSWEVKNNANYIISNLYSSSLDIKSGNNIYVNNNATFTITGMWGGSSSAPLTTIHILSGSTLDLTGVRRLERVKINIYNGAFIKVADNLNISNNSEVNIFSKEDFNNIVIENTGKLYVRTTFMANSISLTNTSKVTFNGCANVKTVSITNDAELVINSYLEFLEEIGLDSQAKLKLAEGALVKGKTLKVENMSVKLSADATNANYAVISVNTLEIHQRDMQGTFQGKLALDYVDLINRSGTDAIHWSDEIRNNEKNTVIEANNCHTGYDPGNTGGGEDKVEPNFENIGVITSPGVDISATSVSHNPTTGHVYLSWHLNAGPNDYTGHIDFIKMPNKVNGVYVDNAEIFSRVTSTIVDLNHTMFYKDKLYTAGGSRKGALFSVIPLSGETVSTDKQQIIWLEGASGNCVAAVGSGVDERVIAISGAQGGIEIFNDLSFETKGVATGLTYAKYVDVSAQKIAILKGGTGAELKLYDSSDIDLAGTPVIINLVNIQPIDGKNVVRIDDATQRVYIAAGNRGLLSYKFDGTEELQYKDTDNTIISREGSVSGVTFDDEYIYVAYGSRGVHVLNKSTLQFVHSYIFDPLSAPDAERASANFIATFNGYIYVAYGTDGLHIMRFNDGIVD